MTNVRKHVGMDLTEGNVLKQLLTFVLPLLLANAVQQLYNTVDMVVIGQFVGSTGSTGVSNGGEVATLITFIATAFGSAGQIYVAQLTGAKDHRSVSEAMATALVFTAALSLGLTVLCMALCDPMLRALNCPEEAFSQAHNYMMIVSLGLPFIFGYNMICGILRGMGESRRPLLFITVSAVSNIVMDLLLVVVIPLEAAGTAVATVAAQIAAFAASFVFLYRRRAALDIRFDRQSMRIHPRHLRVLLRLGVPLMMQSALIHFTQILCTSHINAYGIVASGTNAIGKRLGKLINIFTSSVNQGSGAMVGQNIGAGRHDRVRQIVRTSVLCAGVCSTAAILVALLLPRQAFSLFIKPDDVHFEAILDLGRTYLRIVSLVFVMTPFQGAYQAVITGSGNARLAMWAGMLDGVVLRLGVSFGLAYAMNLGVMGFFFGDALAHLGPLSIGAVYYYSGRWKTFRLLKDHPEKT